MIPSFRTLAAEPCTVLDEMGLALTAEFRPSDGELALARLDDLAGELAARIGGRSPGDVLACRDLLDRAAGFRVAQRFAPECLMLDAVLERATGHPLLLAIVYAEVGRRAGVELRPVKAGPTYFVAYIGHGEIVMLDPGERGRIVAADAAPARMRWLCAHEVGFAVLGELVEAYAMAGDQARARHAATLRLSLPLDGATRARVEREIRGLDSRLN